MPRTKIICTIGPATNSEEMMRELIAAGANIFRVNCSHGTHEEHEQTFKRIIALRQELGVPLGILLDTQGPEIRTGTLKDGPVELIGGREFILTSRQVPGDEHMVSVSHAGLPRDVVPGLKILLDDGIIELRVDRIEDDTDIVCTVLNGGTLAERKGVNAPLCAVSLPSVAQKDIEDIALGARMGVEYVAASFVRSAADVQEVRRVLEDAGGEDIRIISKIENVEAVRNFAEILQVSNGVMIARGDLGVEIPMEEVPIAQKDMIRQCNGAGRLVITATQMLDSMIHNPRPTRAEATDVANAIFDGTDAIMLSGETAMGKYPVQAVKTMAKIAEKAEEHAVPQQWRRRLERDGSRRRIVVTDAVSYAACNAAMELRAAAIITPTQTGHTAQMVSKYRPWPMIAATTSSQKAYHVMSLLWGVAPLLSRQHDNTDDMMADAVNTAVEHGFARQGDVVVITGGLPTISGGITSMMKVHVVGEVLLSGRGIGSLPASGRVRVVRGGKLSYNNLFEKGDILVTDNTDDNMLKMIKKAGAIIVEQDQEGSHAETVGKLLGIPVILGMEDAMHVLPEGLFITVDPQRGFIYNQRPGQN
ncbi:MAG: pyruvate kinase [Christensenellales bacterium]|jgi:pyruvate kinase